MDESELAERNLLEKSGRADPTHIWGNDGLVTVRSAQYGEWLGVVDGCDHWDTRGANGFSRAWVEGRSGWAQFLGVHKREGEEEATTTSLSSTKSRIAHIDGGQGGKPGGGTNNPAVLALVDWIANRVSSQAAISGLTSTQSAIPFTGPGPGQTGSLRSSKRKFDLELFYIALARNLYDAGL